MDFNRFSRSPPSLLDLARQIAAPIRTGRAAIHTDDPSVRNWAAATFSDYWERATPFDPAAFEE